MAQKSAKVFSKTNSEKTKKLRVEMKDYDDKSREEFPPVSYVYEKYSLSELALIAKTDSDARDEYLKRVDSSLRKYTHYLCDSRPYLDANSVFIVLEKAANKVIDIYDGSYGYPIENLLRKNLQSYFNWFLKNEAVKYHRELAALGKRVCFSEISFFDSMTDERNPEIQILEKVDMEEFMKTLDKRDQEILNMYIHSYTYRQIAETVGMTSSAISYRISVILEKFEKMRNKND